MECDIAHVGLSSVEGPGRRIGIWFQGCSKDCPSCFNQELRVKKQGYYRDTSLIEAEILACLARDLYIEGITLSGGEPLDQMSAVMSISKYAHKFGLSVLIYTGYTPENMSLDRYVALRESVDIAIVGEYRKDVPQTHAWAGSGNQEIILFTDRYTQLDVYSAGTVGKVEVRISKDGDYIVTGFPQRR
jgi:anaerobic ribonucleoside-triphosphate reductase activating protein